LPLKLLIADDERLFRQSLRFLLESVADIKVVAEASDGHEAVVMARETQPNIALLDVDMPKMDGIKAVKLISQTNPATKILMLSCLRDDEKIRAAIAAGAKGYLLKDTDREEFIRVLRHTQSDTPHSSPYLAHLTLDQSPAHDARTRADRERCFVEKYGLSEFEIKALHLISQGLNNEEIGRATCLARETVKGYLKALFRKLQVKNRTEAAVMAIREGIG